MSGFIEAIVLMLPREAGGRSGNISPRDGSYRPFARPREGGPMLRLRFIEGPPTVAPGDTACVVAEVESLSAVQAGLELDLIELDPERTGILTVARVWR